MRDNFNLQSKYHVALTAITANYRLQQLVAYGSWNYRLQLKLPIVAYGR
jgi:hypothetical protein